MRISVLYFGVLKDHFGMDQQILELPGAVDVHFLLNSLRESASKPLSPELWVSLAVAVNRQYASLSTLLGDGDEVALLPPVSGG